jgi:hypothetical protein
MSVSLIQVERGEERPDAGRYYREVVHARRFPRCLPLDVRAIDVKCERSEKMKSEDAERDGREYRERKRETERSSQERDEEVPGRYRGKQKEDPPAEPFAHSRLVLFGRLTPFVLRPVPEYGHEIDGVNHDHPDYRDEKQECQGCTEEGRTRKPDGLEGTYRVKSGHLTDNWGHQTMILSGSSLHGRPRGRRPETTGRRWGGTGGSPRSARA